MIIHHDHLEFDSGRNFTCLKGMFTISENGYLKVLGYDDVVQSHELSEKEMSEMAEYLREKIEMLKEFINNPIKIEEEW